jgi:hypothetical protein
MQNFVVLATSPQGKNPQYQEDRRLGGPQGQSGHCGEAGSKFDLLAACLMLVSSLVYSSTLKMELVCHSETLVNFH